MKKRGAIELSINAIIILIIAIVFLSGMIGFIRSKFTKVSTSFEESISLEPEPPEATESNPITLSREYFIAKAGGYETIKVGIFNKLSADMNGLPIGSCEQNADCPSGFYCDNVAKTCKSLCGNNAIDEGEECDSSLLNGQTCAGLGYNIGNLACASNCKFDTSGCKICMGVPDNLCICVESSLYKDSSGSCYTDNLCTIACTPKPGAPTANAGPDQSVPASTQVQLQGTVTGDGITYTWSFIAQPPSSIASLDNPNILNPKFTPTVAGAYTLQLSVTNAAGTVTDTVVIDVQATTEIECGNTIDDDSDGSVDCDDSDCLGNPACPDPCKDIKCVELIFDPAAVFLDPTHPEKSCLGPIPQNPPPGYIRPNSLGSDGKTVCCKLPTNIFTPGVHCCKLSDPKTCSPCVESGGQCLATCDLNKIVGSYVSGCAAGTVCCSNVDKKI